VTENNAVNLALFLASFIHALGYLFDGGSLFGATERKIGVNCGLAPLLAIGLVSNFSNCKIKSMQ